MASESIARSAHTWESFVRPAVQFKHADPSTRQLVQELMPHFPRSCVVIAGYLDDADQFWKVNYHWELLSRRIAMASGLPVSAASKSSLTALQKKLGDNLPDPARGYTESKKVGLPHDRSGTAKTLARWVSLREAKQAFKKVLDAENLTGKYPPAEGWDLAAAPIAKPGTSAHGTGYAIDVHGAGQNELIKAIATRLGATVAFDEKSHVHLEFKQGVVTDGQLVSDDAHDGRWAGWKQA